MRDETRTARNAAGMIAGALDPDDDTLFLAAVTDAALQVAAFLRTTPPDAETLADAHEMLASGRDGVAQFRAHGKGEAVMAWSVALDQLAGVIGSRQAALF